MSNINEDIYELRAAANAMCNTLAACESWHDNVSDSFVRYTDGVEYRLRSLELEADAVTSKVKNAMSVNAEKHKATLSGFRSRLGSI